MSRCVFRTMLLLATAGLAAAGGTGMMTAPRGVARGSTAAGAAALGERLRGRCRHQFNKSRLRNHAATSRHPLRVVPRRVSVRASRFTTVS